MYLVLGALKVNKTFFTKILFFQLGSANQFGRRLGAADRDRVRGPQGRLHARILQELKDSGL